jgi:hypothetical protein
MDAQIELPFLFNIWKHHLGFLKNFIEKAARGRVEHEELSEPLLKMGNSMIDIYYGSLPVEGIIEDIRRQLVSNENYEKTTYKDLITRSPGRYRNIKISDGSVWTLLAGNDPHRYIHIHPARGSLCTMRIGAVALKTALLLKIFYPGGLTADELVDVVNQLRCEFLGESPIKNLSYTRSISKMLDLL